MAYMNVLSAMNVAREDAKRVMRVGVRNDSRGCKSEVAESFSSEESELFSDFDVA